MFKQGMKAVVWGVCLMGLFVQGARATDGHQLIGVGAVQKGLGGAGVASAKDATWVLLNPAGIVALDKRVDAYLEVFAADRSIEPAGPGLPDLGGAPLANRTAGKSADDSIFYIPSVGVIFPREHDTLGLGFYGVNGMGVNYRSPRTTIPGFRGEDFDRRTEYAAGKLALAYARPLENKLTLGGSIIGNVARFRSDMMTSQFMETKGNNEWDEALGAGFQLGALKQFEEWAVGATYISRQRMEELDKYDDLLKDSLDLPQMVQLGTSWQATKTVELLADYKYIGWSDIPAIGDSPDRGGFGWDDQHVIKMGAEWVYSETVTLRSGVSRGNSPIDEEAVFANALFPAITETHLSAGFSYTLTEHSVVHFTYMHAFENELVESGEGGPFSQVGAGTRIMLEEDTFGFEYSYLF